MRRSEIILTTILVLAITLPFLDKPFHIDDTVVLHVTENILQAFWNPFAGQIDWFGYELDLWKATTNPPFLSYFLAPFALLSRYSEVVLHLAMVMFFLLLGFSMQFLSRRFVAPGYWPLLFLMTSVAVVVSGNVMRDIPGTALGVAAIACFVSGSDQDRRGLLFLGALFAGLAVLTKYSAAVVLPVMALYALLQGRIRHILWLTVAAFLILLWCLQNFLVYGQVHMLYLFLERRSTAAVLWQDKLFGAIAVMGSSLLLFPALIFYLVRKKSWLFLACSILACVSMIWWIQLAYDRDLDLEYFFWIGAGTLAVSVPIAGSLSECRSDRDSIFLLIWFAGILVFSVFMVPFQAVRHLLPALPPLLLMTFRLFGVPEVSPLGWFRKVLASLLLVQLILAMLVHVADFEYAASYRDFAENVRKEYGELWYVGHWGWKFYAERAGFQLLHRDGPYPESGDFLVWPQKVHIGRVFQNERGLPDRLELVSSQSYEGVIPIRTMDGNEGAGFYSVGRGKLPFRFLPRGPLEVMRIYRVKESKN